MTTDDPFSPSADPYPPECDEVTRDPVSRRLDLTRREVAKLALTAPLAVWATACAVHRLGCEALPTDAHSCRHRFCRYYRGP